jgi:hypothetical protein
LTIALVGVAPATFAAGSSDGVPPGGTRTFRGKTSQGQKIQLMMHRIRDGGGVQRLEYGALLRCQDGTKIGLEEGWSWFGPLHPTTDDRFDIDEVSTDEAFHFHGRIGPRGGSGTIQVTFPALTQDEEAQTCTSKERTWSVTRRSPSLDAPCCTPKVTGSIPVLTMTTRVGRGGTHVVRSWDKGTNASASRRQSRFYQGTTSQRLPTDFTTQRFTSSWRLKDTDFAFRIRCEDGQKYGLGKGWGFGGRAGPRLDRKGNFAFDEVDPFERFHLHGRLGAHAGSRTVADTEPGLTQNEQRMLCVSGDRTWTADRAPPRSGHHRLRLGRRLRRATGPRAIA